MQYKYCVYIYICIYIYNFTYTYIIMSAGISLHTFANICMPTCYQLLSSYHDIIRLSQIKSVKMRKHPPGPSTEDARG